MKNRILSVLLMVVVATFAFASGEGEASALDGPVELTYMHFKTGNEAGALPDILERFEEEYPDIDLTVEAISTSGGYQDALKTRLTAGLGVDVFMVPGPDFDNFVESGHLMDLTDTAAADRMLDALRPMYSREGVVYATPMSTAALGMYANMDLLEEAGVESLPQNWNEFLDASEKVKAAGYTPWIMGNKGNTWSAFHSFENAMYAENTPTDELDEAIVNDEISLAELWEPQLEKLQMLIDRDYVNTEDSMGMVWNQEAFTGFVNGEAAFMYGGSWQISLINQAEIDITVKFFPSPLVRGVEAKAHLLPSIPTGVNANTDYPEEALTFFEFLFKPENVNAFVISQSGLTPIKGGESADDPIADPMAEAVADGRAFLWPTMFRNAGHLEDWRTSLSELVLGLKTPEEMAQLFEEQYERKLLLSQ